MKSAYRHLGKGILSLAFSSAILLSCGPNDVQYVEKFEYDIQDNKIDMGVTFNSDFTLNTELTVPIKQYGTVSLVPSTDTTGFAIKTSLNMDVLLDPEIMALERTRQLPSGQPMSSYVQTDVARLWIKNSDQVATSVYFGLDIDHAYIGTAVELGFMGKDFPAGLILAQRIRDHKNRMLGVVAVFGPRMNGETVEVPGGIFFITNTTDLYNYIKEALDGKQPMKMGDGKDQSSLIYNDPTEAFPKKYQDPLKQLNLFKEFKERGKKAGMVN